MSKLNSNDANIVRKLQKKNALGLNYLRREANLRTELDPSEFQENNCASSGDKRFDTEAERPNGTLKNHKNVLMFSQNASSPDQVIC